MLRKMSRVVAPKVPPCEALLTGPPPPALQKRTILTPVVLPMTNNNKDNKYITAGYKHTSIQFYCSDLFFSYTVPPTIQHFICFIIKFGAFNLRCLLERALRLLHLAEYEGVLNVKLLCNYSFDFLLENTPNY